VNGRFAGDPVAAGRLAVSFSLNRSCRIDTNRTALHFQQQVFNFEFLTFQKKKHHEIYFL
jgi:hypothetical protein